MRAARASGASGSIRSSGSILKMGCPFATTTPSCSAIRLSVTVAQKLIEVTVDGAKSLADARKAAREIASSSLVKAMVHGNDPNWGRIMMALGKSGVELEESKIDIFVNDIQIVHEGLAIPFFRDVVVSSMASDPDVRFRVTLNLGDGAASGWGCDLTEEYVTFNSAYST